MGHSDRALARDSSTSSPAVLQALRSRKAIPSPTEAVVLSSSTASSSPVADRPNETSTLGESRHGLIPIDAEDAIEAFFYYAEPRPEEDKYLPVIEPPSDWRSTSKPRTTQAVLLLCLKLEIEPPDVVRTNPCATLECWVETSVIDRDKALLEVAQNLEKQYLSLANSKVRYKSFPDASIEETKKGTQHMRRAAKHDRALLHYNGHGVPKPTASGEVWVFNKTYTQYIPLNLYELLGWVGTPAIFVWDCSAAGHCVYRIEEAAKKRDTEARNKHAGQANSKSDAQDQFTAVSYEAETIQLAACKSYQNLPQNPSLPADLFTSCLTSPIEIALRFFIIRNPLKADLDLNLAFKIPGKLSDRKSPLGELLWIFTAVTDTIAWNTLGHKLFQRLFRHDLVVAALFRGFLLAERIMRYYDCTPISVPALPAMFNHPMWDSWDLAVDRCLNQLPPILAQEKKRLAAADKGEPLPSEIPFQSSHFFADQLQAFEIWLERGTAYVQNQSEITPKWTNGRTRPHRVHPEQLPVILQVLLSHAHRLRALVALCKFLDLGPWAVRLALSVGIFPYVLKLLQAPAGELKPVLIFIWTRILGIHRSCQEDLMKSVVPVQDLVARPPDLPYQYFVKVLLPTKQQKGVLPIPNISEHRAMCSFILSVICRDHPNGKLACLQPNSPVMEACIEHLRDADPLLRQWSALCLAQLWDNYDAAKVKACNLGAHRLLSDMIVDDLPEVRASVTYALGTLLGTSASSDITRRSGVSLSGSLVKLLGADDATVNEVILGIAMSLLKLLDDGSPSVRSELVVLLSVIIAELPAQIVAAAYSYIRADRRSEAHIEDLARKQRILEHQLHRDNGSALPSNLIAATEFQELIFGSIYKTILDLAVDPFPRVAELACSVLDTVHELLLTSPLAETDPAIDQELPSRSDLVHELLQTSSLDEADPDIDQELPLRSDFYDYASRFFREPQLKQSSESDEPGSINYNARLWRRDRADKVVQQTTALRSDAVRRRWDEQVGFYSVESSVNCLLFHQFDDHLICADSLNRITSFDWAQNKRLHRFSNMLVGPERSKIQQSRITTMKLINELDKALLLVGSDDGCIRVWRDYATDQCKLLTAFRALSDYKQSRDRPFGLVSEWQQLRGQLVVGGYTDELRIWDAGKDALASVIPTQRDSGVTALTSEQTSKDVIIAGFGDGSLQIYDARSNKGEVLLTATPLPLGWIQNVKLQSSGARELMSGSESGAVCLWDMRYPTPLQTIQTHQGRLLACDMHDHAPIYATGSEYQMIKLWSTSSQEPMGRFRNSASYLPQRSTANLTTMAFHPHYLSLALGADDGHISIYRCDTRRVFL